MTRRNVELDDYVEVLRKRLTSAHNDDPEALRAMFEAAEVLDLARETAELDDAVDWLIGTLRTIAHFSPSAAFALAGRFAAQRGLGVLDTVGTDTEDLTSAVVNPTARGPWTATVPTLFDPREVVFLDRFTGAAALAPRASLVVEDTEGARRSGLREAALQTLRLAGTVETLPDAVAQRIAWDWDLFTCAVTLGLAEQALATAETYAGERRQFGSAIGTFAGLRAMLAEMQMSVSTVRAMTERAAVGDLATAEALASAGRAAVSVCLNAIQVHGGYGYIDEYPVAGMLRDALSLRARGGGRRALVAQVAARRLGKAEEGA